MNRKGSSSSGLQQHLAGFRDGFIRRLLNRRGFGLRHMLHYGRFATFVQTILGRYAAGFHQRVSLLFILRRSEVMPLAGVTLRHPSQHLNIRYLMRFANNERFHVWQKHQEQTLQFINNIERKMPITNQHFLATVHHHQSLLSINRGQYVDNRVKWQAKTSRVKWQPKRPENSRFEYKNSPQPAIIYSSGHQYMQQIVERVTTHRQAQLVEQIIERAQRVPMSLHQSHVTAVSNSSISSLLPPQPATRVLRRSTVAVVDTAHADRTDKEYQRPYHNRTDYQTPLGTAVDVDLLTNQVVRAIDQRLLAYRERMGRS